MAMIILTMIILATANGLNVPWVLWLLWAVYAAAKICCSIFDLGKDGD